MNDSPLAQQRQASASSQAATADSPTARTEGTVERRMPGRTASGSSTQVDNAIGTPSRSSTLRKSGSLRKRASLSRSLSRRSLRAGAVRGTGDDDDEGFNNVFNTPIPTHGNPTEILANRFTAWRKLLKDLITYFREIQSSYEQRSKALLKVSNVVNNTHTPNGFLAQAGLDEALTTLRGFHKLSLTEANKTKDIEDDVITQLNGLRSDLNQKIKEIKSLSGDFKNSVDKEKEATKKIVEHYKDVLAASESDPAAASGKNDPFIVRLAVERQIERQIEEENYLHRAYLNLEGSGRELESIVIGEIQKAYNAYAGILRREADHSNQTIDDLRSGPIAMPKDREWTHFVEHNDHFVNPTVPIRRFEDIYFTGKFNPAASEIRGGMLERKSKYLKSYTPGWYVMSPTHLHEFKSADHIQTQQPVMSLYLVDQRLGSKSQPGASSHKFSLKGKQTGGMHRGHSWVFRAESYDTMMAWYEDIRMLTEKTGAERTAFVRRHARSVSGGSQKAPASISSDGMDEDEADAEPYAAMTAMQQSAFIPPPKRPEPGGRFPSDLNLNRSLNPPSSGSSPERDNSVIASDTNANQARSPTPLAAAAEASQTPRKISQQNPTTPTAVKSTPVRDQADATPRPIQAPPAQEPLAAVSPIVPTPVSTSDFATNAFEASPAVGAGTPDGVTAINVHHPYNPDAAKREQADAAVTPTQARPGTTFTSEETPKQSSYFDPKLESSALSTQTAVRQEPSTPTPKQREPTLPDIDGSVFTASHSNSASAANANSHPQLQTEPSAKSANQSKFEPQPITTDPAHSSESSAVIGDTILAPRSPDSLTQTGRSITDASSVMTDDTIEAPTPTKNPHLHATGAMFPLLRHDTDASVSDLHVPGGFPPPTPVELE